MKLSQAAQAAIAQAIKTALSACASSAEDAVVTDLYMQPLSESGKLVIYDDDDRTLAETNIMDWENLDEEELLSGVKKDFTAILSNMNNQKELDTDRILKPYSFVLVDANKETVEDLLLIDDDTMILDDELLKGLDEELNDFLKKLLDE